MATLAGVFNTAHTPFCYMPGERWNDARARRQLRADVPLDDNATNAAKYQRIQSGFATLRQKIAEAKPDVLVIFGDDQLECFDFRNYPAFSIFVGDEFDGNLPDPVAYVARRAADGTQAQPPAKGTLRGYRELGVSLLTGLMQRGFDPSFALDVPEPERGFGHAIMNPSTSLTDLDIPVVPVLVNCYYAPQVSGLRSYQFGKAVREAIDEHPADLRVAVIGSGGLWHSRSGAGAYIDEDFDRETLRHLANGDARAMADHFDSYRIPDDDSSQAIRQRGPSVTGMPSLGGPQGGTRETCNWIAAAAVADGAKSTVVDYIPVYASPIGAAFSYWVA